MVCTIYVVPPFHINVLCADIVVMDYRDTVDAVGLIPRRLPFTQVNDNIKYFRHAISLDERRVWVDILSSHSTRPSLP